MKVICAWCKKEFPEKAPYDDPSVSHTICRDCSIKYWGVDPKDKEEHTVSNPMHPDEKAQWRKIIKQVAVGLRERGVPKSVAMSQIRKRVVRVPSSIIKSSIDAAYKGVVKIAKPRKNNPKLKGYSVYWVDEKGGHVFTTVKAVNSEEAHMKLLQRKGDKVDYVMGVQLQRTTKPRKRNPYSSRAKYCHERIKSPKKFDPRSFRTKELGKGVKATFGCPKKKYSPRKKRCKVSMQMQRRLIPVGARGCKVGGKAIGHNRKRRYRRN